MTARRAIAAAFVAFAVAAPAMAAPAQAPAFRARTVDGAEVDLARLVAQGPVLVDFWATWCKPCVTSLPGLERAYARWKPRGLSVVGVSIDGPRNVARVRPFARRLGLTFPIVLDETGALQQRYQVSAIPTSVLVGRDGRIAWSRTGWLPGQDDELEAALAAQFADAPVDSAR